MKATIYEGNKTFDLILKFNASNRGTIENIRNTLIDTDEGQKIPLH